MFKHSGHEFTSAIFIRDRSQDNFSAQCSRPSSTNPQPSCPPTSSTTPQLRFLTPSTPTQYDHATARFRTRSPEHTRFSRRTVPLNQDPQTLPAQSHPVAPDPSVHVDTVSQLNIRGPATSLRDLPAELVHEICNYLDVDSLKAFRLTDSKPNKVAVSHLFSEASINLSSDSLSYLKALMIHPEYASHIKVLDFESSSENLVWTELSMLRLVISQTMRKTVDAEQKDSLTAYESGTWKGLHCKDMLEQGKGLITLLERMPALNSIKFRTSSTSPDPIRGLFALLCGCTTSGVRPKQLHIQLNHDENMMAWDSLKDELHQQDEFQPSLRPLKLTVLAHLVRFNFRSLTRGPGSYEKHPYTAMVFGLDLGPYDGTTEMVNLEVLEISFLPSNPDVFNWIMPFTLEDGLGLIGESKLIRLQSLSLSGMHMGVEYLFALLDNNVGTLKDLQLGKMVIEGGRWKTALPRLRDWIRTSKVETLSVRGRLQELDDDEQIWPPDEMIGDYFRVDMKADMPLQKDIVDYLLS
ncbi:uncharacterized protein BDZ99DRAFT_482704 [Mytilinidion resinicola]|uniref:F-box domain-containing protein n=1 Tax=Mytilinidion resinicola TaxID=574789 RepID=A0A6A6Y175_9PEZI|nr:uncharacterized protein BDZ99DRAFT_482704 [Mytilinidion resinicola]KAF2802566.1 hypothetical protein BDZ99DRAFT_482704 [Mytilinidion resinicola]